jgi:receptor protein-tyrosine kinase
VDLAAFLAIARRWWSTILIATWVAGLAGYLTASGVPPTYEGSAGVLVGPVVADSDVLQGAASLTSTYAELVSSQPVIDDARASLGMSNTLPWVVRASADETTRILVIRTEHGDPEVAAAMANALADALQRLAPDDIAIPEGQLTIIEPAAVPVAPIAPQVTLITILAAGAGLLASTVLVLFIEYLGNTVSTTRDVAELAGVPVLGFASLGRRFRPTVGAPVVVDAEPDSRAAAAVRLIATKVLYTDSARPVQSVLVLGTARRDGAADLAANIASALARSGRRTLLLDANENGEVSQIYGVEGARGLSDALQERAGLAETVIHRGATLEIIPTGLNESMDLYDAKVAGELLEQLRPRYDLILINAAPIDQSGNALVWARLVEGVVVVAERDRTNRDDLKYALEHLAGVGARILGAVMVDHPPRLKTRRPAARGRSREQPAQPISGQPLSTRVTRLTGGGQQAHAARSPVPRTAGQPAQDEVRPTGDVLRE